MEAVYCNVQGEWLDGEAGGRRSNDGTVEMDMRMTSIHLLTTHVFWISIIASFSLFSRLVRPHDLTEDKKHLKVIIRQNNTNFMVQK